MVDPIIFLLITILGVILGIKVTSTQNPVYSGLYLVLSFFLGSGIAFLLGLEFIALLFLLVYAGAIAVLVLFVVMMLDVKAIENPWSPKKKRLVYLLSALSLVFLMLVGVNEDLQRLLKLSAISIIGFVALKPNLVSNEVNNLKNNTELGLTAPNSEGFQEFFRLFSRQEYVDSSYSTNNMWFVEFDTSCALNDPSYLLYSTYAILLIIAGVILLIAMVGAIALTLQKNCPESLYRQLGRESKNAVFSIKEKSLSSAPIKRDLEEAL